MLDTPFPDFPSWRPKDAPPVQFHIPLAPGNTAKNKLAQQQAVNDIIHALSTWELPSWDDTRYSPAFSTASDLTQADGFGKYRGPPRAVFIRALELVPTEKVVEVDWFREEKCLGWYKYPYDFILKELRVQGDHFSMFSAQCVSDRSDRLSFRS